MPFSSACPWPHCGAGAACTMGAGELERCSCRCPGCRGARWGLSRTGAYRYRWQWWMPWGVTDWRVPRVFRGGNEWCSPSLAFVVPPFGCLVVFWKPGRRRTVPCPACWQVLDDAGRADYAPCGRYHGGRLNQAGHAHWETGVCGEAERWLEAHSPGAVLPGEFGRPGG